MPPSSSNCNREHCLVRSPLSRRATTGRGIIRAPPSRNPRRRWARRRRRIGSTSPAPLFNVGTPIDLYRNVTNYTELDLGNWTSATSGTKTFEFGVTGKNAGSFGYTMVIDYIKLIPV